MKVAVQSSRQAIESLRLAGWSLGKVFPPVPWWIALERGFCYTPYHVLCRDSEDDTRVLGCLPLMLVQSRLFGRFLVSLPYLNSAGVVLESESGSGDSVVRVLVDRAVSLADELDVKHLELRNEIRVVHPAFNGERTDKVHMRMALPDSEERLLTSFKSKLRSQVKKAGENHFETLFGGEELLDSFHDVFACNMRDLGTPVYSKGYFRHVLGAFDEFGKGGEAEAELCVVRLNRQPISVALLVHHSQRTEVPSASALRKYNPTNVNMWMYWQILQRAIQKRSTDFDFGRSTIGSGTYRFKEQWGARPSPAVWQYYVRKGDPADMRPDSHSKQRLIKAWQRLPVWLTKLIGPSIVRGIP